MQEEMSVSQGGSRGTCQGQATQQQVHAHTRWVQIPLHFGETTEAFKNTPIKAWRDGAEYSLHFISPPGR